jgi:hypothetical protein
MGEWRRWVLPTWSLLLAVGLLGPALGPGYVLTYDMVWVPDLALRPDFLGLASGLPRAVPSDAVVAVLDEVLPGVLLQKLVLLGALAGGALGAGRLVGDRVAVGLFAATLYGWNPFVVERLLIGHWPVLLGYAVLPWVVFAARQWRIEGRLPARLLWLLPIGSLSAGAGLVTASVLLAFAAGRGRRRLAALLVVAANAPWLAAGALHASSAVTDSSGAAAFALRNEGGLPGPLTALTLGGVWNAEVVPSSREGVLAWVTLATLGALVALGAPRWWRGTAARDRVAYVGCAAVGWALTVLGWGAPDFVGWLVAEVPGGGLLRDGARFLALVAPLLVVTAAEGVAVIWRRVPATAPARMSVAVAVTLAPVALLPDAAWGVASRVEAVSYPSSYGAARDAVARATGDVPGDVLLLPLSSYRQPAWNGGRKVLNPLGRYLTPDYVASDVLVVSGVVVAGEDERARDAATALDAPTPEARAEALERLGISIVVVDLLAPGQAPGVSGVVLLETADLVVLGLSDPAERSVPGGWIVAVAVAWAAFVGLPATGAVVAVRRLLRRRTTNASEMP